MRAPSIIPVHNRGVQSPAPCTLDRIALAVERIAGVLERNERREAARRWAAQQGHPFTKDEAREAPSTAAAA